MNIVQEFAEELATLARHEAQSAEVRVAIVQFLVRRTQGATGSYPLAPLLAQLEQELLWIAAQFPAHSQFDHDALINTRDWSLDRIAHKVADFRWMIREEAAKLRTASLEAGEGKL